MHWGRAGAGETARVSGPSNRLSGLTPPTWCAARGNAKFGDFATTASSRRSRSTAAHALRARSTVRTARPDVEITRACADRTRTGACKTRFSDEIAKSSTLRPPQPAARAAWPPATLPTLAARCVGHGSASVWPNPAAHGRARECANRDFQQGGCEGRSGQKNESAGKRREWLPSCRAGGVRSRTIKDELRAATGTRISLFSRFSAQRRREVIT